MAVRKKSIDWRYCAFLTLEVAAGVAGLSQASLYRAEGEGKLVFKKLAGRTLVETKSFIDFLDTAEPWTASDRGGAARAARAEKAKASLRT